MSWFSQSFTQTLKIIDQRLEHYHLDFENSKSISVDSLVVPVWPARFFITLIGLKTRTCLSLCRSHTLLVN